MSKRKVHPTPEWMIEELQRAMNTFGLGSDWHVFPRVVSNPNGGKNYNGSCQSDSVYLNATIELKKNLEQNEGTRRVILHEMGHVAHSEVDSIVERYILEAIMDDTQRDTFKSLYSDAVERFLQRLSRGLISGEATPEE